MRLRLLMTGVNASITSVVPTKIFFLQGWHFVAPLLFCADHLVNGASGLEPRWATTGIISAAHSSSVSGA